jgi:hypothetical protein
VQSFQEKQITCRRRSSRFESPGHVWVYWRSAEIDDVSPVHDLSVSGLLLVTSKARKVGLKVEMEFLVQEGQIRAQAVVSRSENRTGLGLKFTAICDQDRRRLAELLARLRSFHSDIRKKYVD